MTDWQAIVERLRKQIDDPITTDIGIALGRILHRLEVLALAEAEKMVEREKREAKVIQEIPACPVCDSYSWVVQKIDGTYKSGQCMACKYAEYVETDGTIREVDHD